MAEVIMTRIHTAEGVKWQIETNDEVKVFNSNAEALRMGLIEAAKDETVLQVVPWPEIVGEAESEEGVTAAE